MVPVAAASALLDESLRPLMLDTESVSPSTSESLESKLMTTGAMAFAAVPKSALATGPSLVAVTVTVTMAES